MSKKLLDVLVTSSSNEADRVNSFELRPCNAAPLPPFTAGAHIDLHLPNGMIRSYSLMNPPCERHRYVIAVSHDRASRGGSRYVFEHALVGHTIRIGAPANNFRLVEDGRHSVLIGGGIGITPLYCMIQRLEELGASWELHYAVRSRAACAFLSPFRAIEQRKPGRVHINFDLEDGRLLDLPGILGDADPDAHLYCCGPVPMLEAFKAAAAGRSVDKIHLEYFTTAPPPIPAPASGGGFTVTIASTGRILEVPAGKSILEVLLEAGIDAESACQAGACGTCAVGVLVGIPDHQDYVLTSEERAANNKMMVCVSRSKTDNLVLDL